MNTIDIRSPVAPFQIWFRGLTKPVQWLLGVPFIWASVLHFYRVPEEGEPQQAIFVTLIIMAVTIVLSELLRPKPNIENARPAGLGDFQVPTTTEGRPIPLVWGTVRQRGANVIWYGDLLQDAITERIKTGLWTSTRITKGFRYFLGIQMGLCRGPNVVLKRVWIGDDEVFDGTVSTDTFFDINEPNLFGGEDLGQGGVQTTVDFYTGSATQVVNAYLNTNARQRIASAITPTAPRYIGTSYVVTREFTSAAPLSGNIGGLVGTSTSIKPWSFEVQRFPALFAGQAGGENIISSVHANPVNVVYEILTDAEWGFGFDAADIDVGIGSSFLASANSMITEVNGFSLLLDREMPAKELINELQRQIDGVVFLSQSTGKWTIKLARDDYDIDLIPQLTDVNVVEVRDFSRGSFEDTTNTISVQYDKRDDDYKLSFALAQDMANTLIQGDGTVLGATSTIGKLVFPGVKDSALASNIAWRELRGQAYPMSRCALVVNRQMWEVSIGDVVAWTNTQLGFVKLPMRVTRIDYGRLQSNRMTLTVVQDVFNFAQASMGTPPATGWVPPTINLVAYPAAQIRAIECPRGILVRDPFYGGVPEVAKVFATARRQSGEVTFLIKERHSASTPSGTFAEAGEVFAFTKIGQLDSALAPGQANPVSSILINGTPDGQTALEAAFDDAASDSDLGQQLTQIILVGDEFMLVRDAADSGGDVALQGVFRGALDSAQQFHVANTDVFLLHLGSGITDSNFVNTNNVDIELRSRTSSGVFDGAVTPIAIAMNKRTIRPYPVGAIRYNGTATDFGIPDLEGDGGAGENTFGFDTDWLRRRHDTDDELASLTVDTDPNGANKVSNTQYQVRVFVDPTGANTEIASSPFAFAAGTGAQRIDRLEILDIAAADTEIRMQIQTRHDYDGDTQLTSTLSTLDDSTPTTVNSGLFYFGGNIGVGPSSSFAVVDAGVHTVDIGAAPSGGLAEYRINGGSWLTITAGGTATASLSVSDTVEVRYSTGGVTPDPNFVWLDNPSAVRVAYGTL